MVAVGCNIHDSMVGFIRVVDAPFAVKTDAKGVAVLRGVPGGAATLTVWHPYAKAKGAGGLARRHPARRRHGLRSRGARRAPGSGPDGALLMFGRLRTRLTVLYAALFAIGLGLVALVVYGAIATNAARVVKGELQANATVFDRLWAARSKQLEDGA